MADEVEAGGMGAGTSGAVQTTVSGAAWNYVAFVGSKAATFAATIVLTRLLAPGDFGLLALALLVVTYLDSLRDGGIAAALVHRASDDDRLEETALVLSLASGFVLALLVAGAAPAISEFFDDPALVTVLRVLALTFLLTSVSGVAEARLTRRLAFRRRVAPEVVRAVSKAVVSISLAAAGYGVWALVWGQLAGTASGAVMYFVVGRWRPRLAFNRPLARELLAYGFRVMALGVLAVVIKDVDYLIIGRTMSADQLGFYTLAFRIPELAVISTCYVFSQALFPVLSRQQADPTMLRDTFLSAVRTISIITVPLGIVIALVAPELVQVLYGQRWSAAGPVLRLLAIYAVVSSLAFVAGDLYKATGRPGLLVRLALVQLPLQILVLAVSSRWGIRGIATAQCLLALARLLAEALIARRILQIQLQMFGRALLPAVGAASAVCATGIPVHILLTNFPALTRLVVTSAVCGLTAAATISFADRRALTRIRGLLKRAL